MLSTNTKQCISINQDWWVCIWWSLVTLSLHWKGTSATWTWWKLRFRDQTQRKDERDHATTGVYHIPVLSKCLHKISKGRRKIEGFSRQAFLLIAVSACESWISWVTEGGKTLQEPTPAQSSHKRRYQTHISCNSSWATNHGITNPEKPTVHCQQAAAVTDKSCNTKKKKYNTWINCSPKLVRLLTPFPVIHITERTFGLGTFSSCYQD